MRPPEGFVGWSLRPLADPVIELDYNDSASYETIRRVLKKQNQALATQRLDNPNGTKRQFFGKHGNGFGCLQTPF